MWWALAAHVENNGKQQLDCRYIGMLFNHDHGIGIVTGGRPIAISYRGEIT